MHWAELFLILFIAAIFIFFFYAAVVSILENEKHAAILLFATGIVLVLPYALQFYYFNHANISLNLIVPAVYLLFAMLLFFPFQRKSKFNLSTPKPGYDERDIMFSRRLLKPGSVGYREYYKANPDKEKLDRLFREKPGLLAKGSTHYDPLLFNAALASFDTVEAFHPLVEGLANEEKFDVSSRELTVFVKKWALKLGAKDIGFTELKDYHKYSYVGRGKDYGKPVELDHKYAIALTVEMDKALIDTAPNAPVTLETSLQYLESGEVAVQIAKFLRRLGYEARAHIDGNYRVICPLVARDAGLGDIGRMGLLMTPRQGPRVRIAVVTTNAPLVLKQTKNDSSVSEFCRICKKCAETCPSRAIPFGDETEIEGVKRWQINQEKCFTYWCQAGTDCGRCIAVCPYSHPDNLFHNLVRFGIKYNPFFRRIAAVMDDFFTGESRR